jgi:hypothetical protein
MQELLKARHQKPGDDVPSRMITHSAGLSDAAVSARR